jgi:integrase
MRPLSALRSVPDRSPQHAPFQEYRDFLLGYCDNVRQRKHLLGFYDRFVRRYPNLHDWFTAPLPERIGKLQLQTDATCTCRVSYEARSYLLFLGVAGYAAFDWEWILALSRIDIWKMLDRLGVNSGFAQLHQEAIRLGYNELGAHHALRRACAPLFLASGIPHVDQISDDQISTFLDKVRTFAQRANVALYHGSAESYRETNLVAIVSAIHLLRVALYHRGQLALEPRKSPYRSAKPTLTKSVRQIKPRMMAVVDRYLGERALDSEPRTIKKLDTDLSRFVDWLTKVHPDIASFAEVRRDHISEYGEALRTMIGRRTRSPLSELTRRGSLAAMNVFFRDVVQRSYDDVPARPLMYAGDIPKLPQRIPRFIPSDELARLMEGIRTLTCPYQRAALLIARWSGARRDEIRRLAVDCLDAYGDAEQTPRLRLPVGKTKRERLVPIHPEAAEAIQHLQKIRQGERGLTDPKTGQATHFLFLRQGKLLSTTYLFDTALDEAVAVAGLGEEDGHLAFTAHRFRHSVGTQLAEKGAKLHTIMQILGHQSPAMAMVYTAISDAAVLEDYRAVLGPNVAIAGPMAETLRSGRLTEQEIDWLKSNFFKTELELGHCLRLPHEGPCECDLALTCAKFVTTKAYAPRLRRRHRIELQLADDANKRGWSREVERHRGSAHRIEKLLADLGEPLDGPEDVN